MSRAPDALPSYDTEGLVTVLPSVAASLGVSGLGPTRPLPQARRAIVVLIDGLGLELLRSRGGHAPYLRSLDAAPLTCGFPSSTATSMGSFGTGLPPGAHGLVGTSIRDPQTRQVFSELGWGDGPPPKQWQPEATVFQRAADAGVATTHVGPMYIDGSGLTQAALRGAKYRPGRTLAEGVDSAVTAVRADRRALVYLYWPDLDKKGHVHGCNSWQWGAELEEIDAELRRLVASVPRDCSVTVTADHGMVDVPLDARIDVADDPALAAGIEQVAGEPRSLHLYCADGAADEVAQAWRAVVGDRAWVLTREEAVDGGWLGPVNDRVLPRLGDVLVATHAGFGIVDSRHMTPQLMGLLGHHGSLTADELAVPLLHVPAAASV